MVETCDLFVIGGGVNGAAIARDAAGRGLRVQLAEARDYAWATSSASSKLIHGGLRYLEQFAFALVRESLHEREVMLRTAPHLVRPLRFLLPVMRHQPRPAWTVHLGLRLYDLLAGRTGLPRSGRLAPDQADIWAELKPDDIRAVLHYPDCQVDDARLVLSLLLDARARGAVVRNYCRVTALTPGAAGIDVTTQSGDGAAHRVRARVVVNAGGPWADTVAALAGAEAAAAVRLRLVRGSHIVVRAPRGASADAYTLQNDDRRVVFVLPWLDGRYRVIGTTDVAHHGAPETAACTDDERDYLLAAYNRFFRATIDKADIVWSWAGVRPLADDGKANPSAVSREYRLDARPLGGGTLLSVIGGKLTTHRTLAEEALALLASSLGPLPPSWTASAPLAGGLLSRADLDLMWRAGPDVIPADIRRRWAFTYGSDAQELFARALEPAARVAIAPGVLHAELDHAVQVEDARCAADFLCRRTTLHLTLDAGDRARVAAWFAARGVRGVVQAEA